MATGNRGDDLRSLRLCEMQPYDMPHPNNVQVIKSVLGLQGEEKAGLKGMQSVCCMLSELHLATHSDFKHDRG